MKPIQSCAFSNLPPLAGSGNAYWLPLGNSLETLGLPRSSKSCQQSRDDGVSEGAVCVANSQPLSSGTFWREGLWTEVPAPILWAKNATSLSCVFSDAQTTILHASLLDLCAWGLQAFFLNLLKPTDIEQMKCPQQ